MTYYSIGCWKCSQAEDSNFYIGVPICIIWRIFLLIPSYSPDSALTLKQLGSKAAAFSMYLLRPLPPSLSTASYGQFATSVLIIAAIYDVYNVQVKKKNDDHVKNP